MATLSWWRVEVQEGAFVRATLVAAETNGQARSLIPGRIAKVVFETTCAPGTASGSQVAWVPGGRHPVDAARPELPSWPVNQ